MGGSVKKGEKGCPIFFYADVETAKSKEANKDEKDTYKMMRSFTVFNMEQTEGIDDYLEELKEYQNSKREDIENILSKSSVKVIFEGTQPCYRPADDVVVMTEMKYFHNAEGYYSTLFHEMAHATGHESRLNRPLSVLDKKLYSFEELTAEITSVLICGHFGVNIEQGRHAEYLNGWISVLKDDKRVLWRSASKAQKAMDWLLEDMGEVEQVA